MMGKGILVIFLVALAILAAWLLFAGQAFSNLYAEYKSIDDKYTYGGKVLLPGETIMVVRLENEMNAFRIRLVKEQPSTARNALLVLVDARSSFIAMGKSFYMAEDRIMRGDVSIGGCGESGNVAEILTELKSVPSNGKNALNRVKHFESKYRAEALQTDVDVGSWERVIELISGLSRETAAQLEQFC